MKKHTYFIRLIVITTTLIGLGIIAFKYLHTQHTSSTKINAYTIPEKEIQPNLSLESSNNVKIQAISRTRNNFNKTAPQSKVRIQSYTTSEYNPTSCTQEGHTCSKNLPCCATMSTCESGRCLPGPVHIP